MNLKKVWCFALACALAGTFLTGCGEKSGSSGKSEKSEKSKKKAPLKLDTERIAADEKNYCIEFSEDKKTLVRFPEGVTGVKLPVEYTIPDGVIAIGKDAFANTRLKKVTIPESVTEIGEGAFFDCRGISVNIPDSVKTIGDSAFGFCDGIDLTIPAGVTHIGNRAFATCGAVKVPSGNPVFYNDESGALIDRKQKKLLHLPCSFSGAYVIPSGVTAIDDQACRGARLTSVTIPNGVTAIGSHAFAGCLQLASVTIPSSVTTIGDYAFIGCPCEEQVKRDYPHLFK